MARSLGIIGCGKMAYALIQGVKKESKQQFSNIYCSDIDPGRQELFKKEFHALPVELDELLKKSSLIFLAVKPQQVWQVLQQIKGRWAADTILVSIAAGIKTSDLENAVDSFIPVIRVMPNTPCLVGNGVCAISGGCRSLPKDVEWVRDILSSLGTALVLDEKYMDAVTAVSGSGPAYAYLVIEAMINAAVNIGLDAATARMLVLGTFQGSIKMIEQSGAHPAVLREQVCSPAGTTIAGVRQLEAKGLRQAFFDAIESAYQRSIELGQSK